MRQLIVALGITALLAGCGSADKDRAVSGGGIGAGLGGLTGLLIGGPVGGVVLGGAFGVATGLVTDPATIDLGEPFWNDRGVAKADDPSGQPKPVNDSFDPDFEILE